MNLNFCNPMAPTSPMASNDGVEWEGSARIQHMSYLLTALSIKLKLYVQLMVKCRRGAYIVNLEIADAESFLKIWNF